MRNKEMLNQIKCKISKGFIYSIIFNKQSNRFVEWFIYSKNQNCSYPNDPNGPKWS